MPRHLLVQTGLVLSLLAAPTLLRASDCTVTSVGKTPLVDLGPGLYLGLYQGGHYPGGANVPPPAHDAEGRARAAAIQPLDTTGTPASGGRIVLLSIGMSNTTQEFCSGGSFPPCNSWTFTGRALAHPFVNFPEVAIINGARGGQAVATWDDPTEANYDMVRDDKLAPAGLTESQVQVAWVKLAQPGPTLALPNPNADAFQLVTGIGDVIRAMRVRYQNLRIVFLSNRIYAGYATTPLNPEPYAYESGFAVKWLVQAQIDQVAAGVIVNPLAGDLNYLTGAPWLAWGPDLWADGTTPRSDGLTYICGDLESDGTHPATGGESKVGRLLLNHFMRSPYAYPWFAICRPGDVNGDGRVDGADIQGFTRTLLNPPAATPAERCACDSNVDGNVLLNDQPGFVQLLLSPEAP